VVIQRKGKAANYFNLLDFITTSQGPYMLFLAYGTKGKRGIRREQNPNWPPSSNQGPKPSTINIPKERNVVLFPRK
jgi:hypothetical protein